MNGIYLDHAATTPLSADVLHTMMPYLTEHYGNPSSLHSFGRNARHAITESRDTIAGILGCSPGQLFFTSGGTESDNMAIIGVAEARREQGRTHIVTTAVEHAAVLQACRSLERRGFHVTYVPVDSDGQVHPESIKNAIGPDTALVSVMYVNNETGTIQPVEEIGRICREANVPFHVDAVQALGAIPINLGELPVDLMSFSAHKIGGPKAIGLLYASQRTPIHPLLYGGSQERKRRPGTENVASIVGFAKAIQLTTVRLDEKQQRMIRLRQRFHRKLEEIVGTQGYTLNGHPDQNLPSIVNVSFPGTDKEAMLMNLDLSGVAVSGGSACTSGSLEDSHVLQAMGVQAAVIKSAIRFSFAATTTETEVEQAAQITGTIANRLRNK